MAGSRAYFLSILLLLMGCGDPLPTPAELPLVAPSHGPQSGYFEVRVHVAPLAPASSVEWLRLGNIYAYDLTPSEDGTLRAMVQGHPTAGPVEVSFGVGDQIHSLGPVFHYDAPLLEGFDRLHAIGASLTQGTQRGVPTPWSIRYGPAAQLARHLGLYFPLPMLIEEGLQEMTPDLIGPPPYCQPPPMDTFQIDQATQLIADSIHPDTGQFDYALLRVDPLLPPHNLAVGGIRVGETIDGPASDDLALNFLSHLVYEPSGPLGAPVSSSQMERLEASQPELVVSFDLLANDLIEGMINNEDFTIAEVTPEAQFLADIDRAVDRLAATGAQVFVANLPDPTALPFFRAKRARLKQRGLTDNADLAFERIRSGCLSANARLAERASLYENVHVVDVAAQVVLWQESGVQVGADTLYVAQYGGLVGLDGLHFSDTAYALMTNLFLEKMSAAWNRPLPLIDVVSIWANDRERPDRLQTEGLNTLACEDFP